MGSQKVTRIVSYVAYGYPDENIDLQCDTILNIIYHGLRHMTQSEHEAFSVGCIPIYRWHHNPGYFCGIAMTFARD